jgi:hypothetical protein
MEQKKIDELKKLMAFGFCLIDRIKSNGDFTMYLISSHQNDIVKLLAHCACVFDDDTAYEFKEPQTTKLLEQAYSEYMEFKKSEQGETL